MNYTLIYTHSYLKRAQRFLRQHPELAGNYEKTLNILEINPHHPSLRLHTLKGRLKGLHSISINLSYRITLEFYVHEREIVLVHVGSHQTVYG